MGGRAKQKPSNPSYAIGSQEGKENRTQPRQGAAPGPGAPRLPGQGPPHRANPAGAPGHERGADLGQAAASATKPRSRSPACPPEKKEIKKKKNEKEETLFEDAGKQGGEGGIAAAR